MSDQSIEIGVKRLDHGADLALPQHATPLSAGVDLLAAVAQDLRIEPGQRALVPTGLSIELPAGFEAQVRPRSGLANKHGVTVLNAPGTIDADYRGEVCVLLINHGNEVFTIERGMRIAQMVVAPVSFVTWRESQDLSSSARGAGGFGSTGTHHPVNPDSTNIK
ncbi:dUTP diphosphatase [Magnetovibrio sp.]|uniref:dUTP diphosphatase n=1 Tax=Magnetovibrio sp. TaxID=2024836 RepID=UPI002F92E84D